MKRLRLGIVIIVLSLLPLRGWTKESDPATKTESQSDACLSDPECKQHVDTATAQSKASQFADALSAYQRAYSRRDVPWLLVNIGRMQQKLGQIEDALNSYQRFLETDFSKENPELRERVQSYLTEVTDAASQSDACMTDTACRQHVSDATTLSKNNQFEAALTAYKNAYTRRDAAWLLVNIGRMQQKLGRHEESLEAYQRFLDSALGKANLALRVRVQGYLVEAQNTIAEQRKQTTVEQTRLAVQQERLSAIESKLSVEQKRLAAKARPIYKRWWFWTIIGGAVAAGVAAAAVGGSLNSYTREPDYIAGLPEYRPF